jgi:phage host-nuclease inhibitor protein Gam
MKQGRKEEPLTLDRVGEIAGEVVGIRIEIERLENARKRKEDDARAECQARCKDLKAELKRHTAAIEGWAARQPRVNDEPLVWRFPRAVVRWIHGQPRVALKYRVTLGDVVGRLKLLSWGRRYLRAPEPELDKEGLLRDRATLSQEALDEIGVSIPQEDELHVEAPTPAQQSAQQAA